MADLMTLDELLTTTRAVRKRLDFSKPVARQTIEACIAAAQQAPSGGNLQTWGFVVVTEPQKRAALADLYRKGYETFLSTPVAQAMGYGNPNASAEQKRVLSSIEYLVEHLEQVPVLVIPCISPDPRFPKMQECVKSMPHATFVSLPGLNHPRTNIRSDLVLPHVTKFLRENS